MGILLCGRPGTISIFQCVCLATSASAPSQKVLYIIDMRLILFSYFGGLSPECIGFQKVWAGADTGFRKGGGGWGGPGNC